MSVSYQTCVHCREFESLHKPEIEACPIMLRGKRTGWHPANRFTPPVQEDDRICAQCHYPASQHTGDRRACPTDAMSAFTPYPTGKEALQAGQASRCGECGESVSGERAFTEICARCEANRKCPAGCAPFDLPKALAGARLVTRDGHAANDFKKASNNSCDYLATIGLVTWGFNPQGDFLREDYSTPNSFDLFLAAKEEDVIPCCPHRPNCKHYLVEAHIKSIQNPPDTEARPEQSETKRQIVVMEASEAADAFPERRHWLSSPDDPWEPCPRGVGRWEFNWEDYDHRIRPDPAPPRRVFVQCNETNIGHVSYSPFFVPNGTAMRLVEFIELDWLLANVPEVRAKLGMGGEAI